MGIEKAVVLAAGMGTRMRRSGDRTSLTAEQKSVAARGVKALIPIHGRPFLDYVLNEVAAAGFTKICLVVGPRHDGLREYYGSVNCRRIMLSFAVQRQPLGTANAVFAAQAFAGEGAFLVINGDNLYPAAVLRQLRDTPNCAVAGFERTSLIAESNIPPERIARFSVIFRNARGDLERVVEKPAKKVIDALPEPILVNMNCWRFEASIFSAIKAIPKSPRGEFELTDAVQYAILRLGVNFGVIRSRDGVFDMTQRADIASIVEVLRDTDVQL